MRLLPFQVRRVKQARAPPAVLDLTPHNSMSSYKLQVGCRAFHRSVQVKHLAVASHRSSYRRSALRLDQGLPAAPSGQPPAGGGKIIAIEGADRGDWHRTLNETNSTVRILPPWCE
jgi:hypothetical protein